MKTGKVIHFILRGGRRAAFTLVEVMATLVIISILFAGVLKAYHQVLEGFIEADLRERATVIAQRQMERLLASRQEPNSVDTIGVDELDPDFEWELTLKREPLPGAKPPVSLPQTVIVATVKVKYIEQEEMTGDYYDEEEEQEQVEPDEDEEIESEYMTYERPETQTSEAVEVELVRYFPWLTPREGETIAVPLAPEVFEEPQWLIELRQELGREPTLDEIIRKLGLPLPEEMEENNEDVLENDETEPTQPD